MSVDTVFIDYDGTIHDLDSILIEKLDGIMGLSGEQLYNLYVYDIHRGIIHEKFKDKHDDLMFHCKLIFKSLEKPYDSKVAYQIIGKFHEANEIALKSPGYFSDAIPSLKIMKDLGFKMCLSTGREAKLKAMKLQAVAKEVFFDHIFSEPSIGFLKTEPEYYRKALKISGAAPRKTASIGDTPLSDIRPAKIVGMKTIWLNRRGETPPLIEDQKADFEVRDLNEATKFLVGVKDDC
jgi:FMN phosphatase YigB (HAD superfamily)